MSRSFYTEKKEVFDTRSSSLFLTEKKLVEIRDRVKEKRAIFQLVGARQSAARPRMASDGCGDCSQRRRHDLIINTLQDRSSSLPRDAGRTRISTSGSGSQASHASARVSVSRLMNYLLRPTSCCPENASEQQ